MNGDDAQDIKWGLMAVMRAIAKFHKNINAKEQTVFEVSDVERAAARHLAEQMHAAAKHMNELFRKNNDCVFYLRAHLHLEELAEMFEAIADGDEIGVYDSLCDQVFVGVGTALTMDLPIHTGLVEIIRSNLTKEPQPDDPDKARVRNKGPRYTPPMLKPLLEKWRTEGWTQ